MTERDFTSEEEEAAAAMAEARRNIYCTTEPTEISQDDETARLPARGGQAIGPDDDTLKIEREEEEEDKTKA